MNGHTTKVLIKVSLFASAFLAVAVPAAASASTTLPPMRPGWWQSSSVMQMNMKGQPPDTDNTPTVRYNCFDAASFAAAMKLMTSGGMAKCVVDLEGSGSNYTMAITCPNPNGGAGSINSKGTIVLTGDTEFRSVTNAVSNIPEMPMTIHSVDDAKWLGACPAGVVPGDYGTMQNGVFQKAGHIDAK